MLMPILAIVFALLVGAILIVVMGLDVTTAYPALLQGAFGSKNAIGETIVKTTPLIFTALSYALAKRCGMVNLGAEGQIYIGGLCSAIVGLYFPLPAVIHIPLAVIAGFVGGGLWGMLAGALKIKFGASEMITTIMLNYLANYFVNYMVGNVIKEPGDLPQSAKILSTAQMPRLVSGTRIHLGIVIALLCVVLYYVFLWRTRQGFETRVVGLNPEAARYAGFNTDRRSLGAMFMAGGLAGLAGLVEILGIQLRV
ncbi:ABC transporter permease [Pseudoflavonifractor sp. MSJ-37]|uniref:ABC transporter permease n=1 Tax=Pseudoflavonifractor sp. MSJ-37 TaxID=2841531 RepID=UPI001C100FE8|nr:ABC transporter permease [Pseudoflavonifractor sp. MSJ-37]MBU5434100.1 ABC transporter permease [Pseudoflavonifractor sp. MSJ-37]